MFTRIRQYIFLIYNCFFELQNAPRSMTHKHSLNIDFNRNSTISKMNSPASIVRSARSSGAGTRVQVVAKSDTRMLLTHCKQLLI